MATIIYSGTGTFENNGDTDWFKIHLTAGLTYKLTIGAGNTQNLLLQAYYPDGHLLNIPFGFSNVIEFVAPTTGDYFMSAHSFSNPIGFYSINLQTFANVAIPGWINTPPSLTVGTTRHVSAAEDGSTMNEWFGVDLVAGQSYTLATSTFSFVKTFIADATGKLLFTDSANVTHFTATTTGHYFAAYSNFGGGQGYDIKIDTVADDHPDNAGSNGAGSFAIGTPATGVWESGGDTDWYAITLTAGSSYDLSLSSTEAPNNVAQTVGIADASGNILYSGTTNSVRFSPTTTGTYYMSANVGTISSIDAVNTTSNTVNWHYSLTAAVNANDLTDNILTTGAITVGAANATSSSWSNLTDTDWFRVTLTQGQTYSFTLNTNNFSNIGLALYDSAGHIVPVTANTYGPAITHTAETTGTYYIAAIPPGQVGAYTIRAAAVTGDDYADNISTTGHLTVGGTVSGMFETAADHDWFAVELLANRTYAMSGDVGALRDAAGNALNVDGPTFTTTTAGTYYVEAASGGSTGAYSVGIALQTDDFLNNVNTTGLIKLNFTGDGADDTYDAAGLIPAVMSGQGGNDVLLGSDLADTINGGDGDDRLYGRAGNDALNGALGNDIMAGGTGDDLYTVDSTGDLVFENPGEGIDRISSGISFYLYADVENLTLTGSAAIYGVGNELDNLLIGNTGDNTLLGGLGADTIRGGSGVDILYGEDGNDILGGDAGNDFLAGGQGDDVMDGGTGGDSLYGEAGNDTLTGGTDFVFDQLVGGDGNDILHGDSGQADYDYLYGNAGDDSFYVDTGDDLTFEQAGEGVDTVYATIPGANNGVYLYANIENLVLLGTTAFGVGNELANAITGNASSNTLLGGDGADTINGLGGNDILFGQAGADIFVFGHGTGVDTIGDFTAGSDRIDLTAIGYSWSQVQNSLHEVGGNTAIDLGGGDVVILNGVTVAQLHQSDFILSGGSGSAPEPLAVAAIAPSSIELSLDTSSADYRAMIAAAELPWLQPHWENLIPTLLPML